MAVVTTSSLFLVLIEESVIPMGLDRDAVWPVEDFWIVGPPPSRGHRELAVQAAG